MEGAPLALSGVRVLDFTHFIAGPFATTILADLGADVIKVEAPIRGDEFRHYPPSTPGLPAQGAPFVWTNRNKRSLAVDLKTKEGVDIILELIREADVVAENFSTGVMERFGLGYDDVRKVNLKVIYLSVSAYGREGEFADRLGFDPVVQAESGFMSMNGYPDRPGVRASSTVMDISTAMMASNAVLAALFSRERTGIGQRVDVALFSNAVLMAGYSSMQYLFSGQEPKRHGNVGPDTCPSGVFECSDASFILNCANDKIYERLTVKVLERPDLASDPELKNRDGRMLKKQWLLATVGELFKAKPWSHWGPRMRAAQIPCGEVRSLQAAVYSAESKALGVVTKISHPTLGEVPNIEMPFRLSETPVVDPRPAPGVGEHTAEILSELLGYPSLRVSQLVEKGVLG